MYAPASQQAALRTLFLLDERLGRIVTGTTEPMIGLMRLAWWREAIEAMGRATAPAEPLLESLARHIGGGDVPAALAAEIEDGWAALLDEPDPEALAGRHGWSRGRALFEAAAHALGADDRRLLVAGEVWALADLAFRHSDAAVRTAARRRGRELAALVPPGRWPRSARPLAALYVLARRDLAADRRRQGSPVRLLRMLALRFLAR